MAAVQFIMPATPVDKKPGCKQNKTLQLSFILVNKINVKQAAEKRLKFLLLASNLDEDISLQTLCITVSSHFCVGFYLFIP